MLLASVLLVGAAAPAELDSQLVLARYASALAAQPAAQNLIFSYTLSQAGPHNIEQQHRIYRSGGRVRDETLTVDGQGLKHKITRIAQYRDRYAIARLAPRETEYTFLFLSAARNGKHYDYTYEVVPLVKSRVFSVQKMTIDGTSFLPSMLQFSTSNGTIDGTGRIQYSRRGAHWVPTVVEVAAAIGGKPARERISFSAYAFPNRFPPSTFQPPKPLPVAIPTH